MVVLMVGTLCFTAIVMVQNYVGGLKAVVLKGLVVREI